MDQLDDSIDRLPELKRRSGPACTNKFPRVLSGLEADCELCGVVHSDRGRLRRTVRLGWKLGARHRHPLGHLAALHIHHRRQVHAACGHLDGRCIACSDLVGAGDSRLAQKVRVALVSRSGLAGPRSTGSGCEPAPNTSVALSSSCSFHCMVCDVCTPTCLLSSAIVWSSRIAGRATRAINAWVCVRRVHCADFYTIKTPVYRSVIGPVSAAEFQFMALFSLAEPVRCAAWICGAAVARRLQRNSEVPQAPSRIVPHRHTTAKQVPVPIHVVDAPDRRPVLDLFQRRQGEHAGLA